MLNLIKNNLTKCQISKRESFRLPLSIWIYSRLTPYIIGSLALFCVLIKFFNKWINCTTRDHLKLSMTSVACIFEMSYSVPTDPYTRIDMYYGIMSMRKNMLGYLYYKTYLYLIPIILLKVWDNPFKDICFTNQHISVADISVSYSDLGCISKTPDRRLHIIFESKDSIWIDWQKGHQHYS